MIQMLDAKCMNQIKDCFTYEEDLLNHLLYTSMVLKLVLKLPLPYKVVNAIHLHITKSKMYFMFSIQLKNDIKHFHINCLNNSSNKFEN